ncbi:MMS19 nucleotide excision repair protein homolog [Cylas formicarius]|uniref:MMS19 nucleotide excision repair protein homolog n=1 Tax=Cylas formicarius TaxID=197179 RepID=UPI0029585A71|nr:MMS19 nucleotide excision repair protein homolog [Cylas formicarius]
MEVENCDFQYLDKEKLKNLEKDDSNFPKLCATALSDIQLEKLTVLNLVELISDLLTNQSYIKRELGLSILTYILQNLNKDFLTSDQLQVLSSYFSEKLRDHHQLIPTVLEGLFALSQFSKTPSTSIIQLLTSIFQHVVCQQQQQRERYTIYQIYELVLKKYSLDVKNLGPDIVYGIISSIDGERDPKNLLYLFNWLPLFLQTVQLGHLSEEMFEVLACYFPVDFKAPPSDTNKITRQDLANALCLCLTGVVDFGEYCLPLALEKFESALTIAKEDSLMLLKKGCDNFLTTVYNQYSVEIWSQLQKEILSSSNDEFREKCLETFTAVVDKLSGGDEKEYISFLSNIFDSLKGNLFPDYKLFLPSLLIIISVGKANKKSSLYVCKKILPLLENTYSITTNTKDKVHLLSNIMKLVDCFLMHNNDINECREVENSITSCVEAIIGLDVELKIQGFNGITILVKLLPKNVRELVIEHLIQTISKNEMLKLAKCQCLEQMAIHYPEEVKTKICQKGGITDTAQLDSYLEILCTLSHLSFFKTFVVDTLLNHTLNKVTETPVGLNHINREVEKSDSMRLIFQENNFIEELIQFVKHQEHKILLENTFLKNIMQVLTKLVRHLPSDQQKKIVILFSTTNFKLKQLYVAVLTGINIPLNPDVLRDTINISSVLEGCFDVDVFIKDACLKVLASLINKMNDESILLENLNILKRLFTSKQSPELEAMLWTTKALVMRNHHQAWIWTDQLLALLDSYEEICNGFPIIMNDCPELSVDNLSNVMPLYRQKFFIYCTNKLADAYNPTKHQYLTVIGYLIEFAPKIAIIAQFQKIYKLIILSLEQCQNPRILEIILDQIYEFTETKESVIADHLEDILLRVLNLTTYNLNMRVRIAAIKCLKTFVISYEVYKLLPLKEKVIKHLGICLDDRKRLVRKEASDTRSLWFLLDAVI